MLSRVDDSVCGDPWEDVARPGQLAAILRCLRRGAPPGGCGCTAALFSTSTWKSRQFRPWGLRFIRSLCGHSTQSTPGTAYFFFNPAVIPAENVFRTWWS
jgi:hypothetical protein